MNFTRPTNFWRELPKELDPWNVTHWSHWLDQNVDNRTRGWPLMDNFPMVVYICIAYILLVIFGPSIFNKLLKEPLNVKAVMIVYNVIVVVINLIMFVGFVYVVITRRYNPICNAVDYSDDLALKLVYAYFISKGVDFTDTAFMIVRKKFDQASFLHVYHHCSMFLIWWIASRFLGGGASVSGPMFNSFVHVIMYSYYLAIALNVQIPRHWKKLITKLQIFQLFAVMSYSVLVAVLDCPFNSVVMYAQAAFLGSLAYLFLKFYSKAYNNNNNKQQQQAIGSSGKVEAPPTPAAVAKNAKKKQN